MKWFTIYVHTIRGMLVSRATLIQENLALRSQLALFEHQVLAGKRRKPRTTPAFRQLWVILARFFADWKSIIVVVKPETVIGWHRTAFRWYWRRKSKPEGRPPVSTATIAQIKRIHKENPLWSPERIHDQLISLGISDVPCPNTIAKYIPEIRKPPSEKARQSWRTFLSNHMYNTWATDFFTVPTITFRILYVLVVISHKRREIKCIAVTEHPTAAWTTQQLRQTTPYDEQPTFLIHDNDPVFRSADVQQFLGASGIESVRIGYRQPQQNPFAERVIGILRRELLDHIIPFDEQHLYKLLKEFIGDYYHPIRTHSSLNHEPPTHKSTVNEPQSLSVIELQSQPILGGLYHSYQQKAA
ncbi:MAG: integrase core domain-containing protein [Armatimonadota bacterium]